MTLPLPGPSSEETHPPRIEVESLRARPVEQVQPEIPSILDIRVPRLDAPPVVHERFAPLEPSIRDPRAPGRRPAESVDPDAADQSRKVPADRSGERRTSGETRRGAGEAASSGPAARPSGISASSASGGASRGAASGEAGGAQGSDVSGFAGGRGGTQGSGYDGGVPGSPRAPAGPAATARAPPSRDPAGQQPEQEEPQNCPSDPAAPMVLVFDGSVSMGLPLDMPAEVEAELDRRIVEGDEAARLEYRRWLEYRPWLESGRPSRLGLAKEAVSKMLNEADQALRIGAVAFTACAEIADHEIVSVEERLSLESFITSVTPHRGGDTALAGGVSAALRMLGGGGERRRGRIIVLTDGKETCGGDVCALAGTIASRDPEIRIDIVDMSGHSDATCLAAATGGRILAYDRTQPESLHGLLSGAANRCKAAETKQGGP